MLIRSKLALMFVSNAPPTPVHAGLAGDTDALANGVLLPAFIPLLLSLTKLRPLPAYFLSACRAYDEAQRPPPPYNKFVGVVLCGEYQADMKARFGPSFAATILGEYNATTCSFDAPLKVVKWLLPQALEDAYGLPGRSQVSVATFQKLMDVAYLILPNVPRLLAQYGNGSWVQFHQNARHELFQIDARSKLRVPTPELESDEYREYCLADPTGCVALGPPALIPTSSGLPSTVTKAPIVAKVVNSSLRFTVTATPVVATPPRYIAVTSASGFVEHFVAPVSTPHASGPTASTVTPAPFAAPVAALQVPWPAITPSAALVSTPHATGPTGPTVSTPAPVAALQVPRPAITPSAALVSTPHAPAMRPAITVAPAASPTIAPSNTVPTGGASALRQPPTPPTGDIVGRPPPRPTVIALLQPYAALGAPPATPASKLRGVHPSILALGTMRRQCLILPVPPSPYLAGSAVPSVATPRPPRPTVTALPQSSAVRGASVAQAPCPRPASKFRGLHLCTLAFATLHGGAVDGTHRGANVSCCL